MKGASSANVKERKKEREREREREKLFDCDIVKRDVHIQSKRKCKRNRKRERVGVFAKQRKTFRQRGR